MEYEYDIPESDAASLLNDFCRKPLIVKRRYKIEVAGRVWDIDEFLGENTGLVVAEVELESEDQPFDRPEWIGREVTGDPKYYNVNLVAHPYRNW